MNFYNVFRIKALIFLHEFGVLAFAVLGKHLEILPFSWGGSYWITSTCSVRYCFRMLNMTSDYNFLILEEKFQKKYRN